MSYFSSNMYYSETAGVSKSYSGSAAMTKLFIARLGFPFNKATIPPFNGKLVDFKHVSETSLGYREIQKYVAPYIYNALEKSEPTMKSFLHLIILAHFYKNWSWSQEVFDEYVNILKETGGYNESDLDMERTKIICQHALYAYDRDSIYEWCMEEYRNKLMPSNVEKAYNAFLQKQLIEYSSLAKSSVDEIEMIPMPIPNNLEIFDDGVVKFSIQYDKVRADLADKLRKEAEEDTEKIGGLSYVMSRTEKYNRMMELNRKRLSYEKVSRLYVDYNNVELGYFDYGTRQFFVNPYFRRLSELRKNDIARYDLEERLYHDRHRRDKML